MSLTAAVICLIDLLDNLNNFHIEFKNAVLRDQSFVELYDDTINITTCSNQRQFDSVSP